MEEYLRQALSRRQKQHIVEPSRLPSAVLMPIYYKEGQYHLLFIKRTETVKNHKGQISFPGGAYSDGDGGLLDTALRESEEEIGLAPADVKVLGMLDDVATITSSYIISPFVALIPWPYQFKVNSEEVEEIFDVPIPALLDNDCLREQTAIIEGEATTLYYYHYQGKIIWGATAKILNQFLGILAPIIKTN